MEEGRLSGGMLKSFGEGQERLLLWLEKYRTLLMILSLLSLFLGVLFFALVFKPKGESWSRSRQEIEKGLLTLEKLEMKDEAERLKLARSIEGRLSISSEFAPFYEGRLAQALIQMGSVEEGRRLLEHQKSRVKQALPRPFELFTESSFLIAEGSFEEAWKKEEELREEILTALSERQEPWGETLISYHLLRRALLADHLGKSEEAAQTKREISTRLRDKKSSPRRQAFEALVDAFRIPSKTFIQYLDSEGFRLSSFVAHKGEGV